MGFSFPSWKLSKSQFVHRICGFIYEPEASKTSNNHINSAHILMLRKLQNLVTVPFTSFQTPGVSFHIPHNHQDPSLPTKIITHHPRHSTPQSPHSLSP